MRISYDAAKNERNIALRDLSFEAVHEFDWPAAQIREDLRHIYVERRFQALGLISGRLYMLVFTPRGDTLHIISLRKANAREAKAYEKEASRP